VAVPAEEQSTVVVLTGEDNGTTTGVDNMHGGGPYIVSLAWGKAGLRGVTEQSYCGTCRHDALQSRWVLRTAAVVGLDTQLLYVVCMRLFEPNWRKKRCTEVAM
jgi:hypothetical protein